MCKQHLNALSVMARSLERLGLGQRPGNVTSLLVNATRDPAERCLWAALRLEQAGTTVARACQIKKCFPVIDQFAGRGEDLARRADVHVSLLVKRSRLKVPSSRFDLSITGMCGAIFLSLTSQFRFAPEPYAVSAASRSGLISKRSSVRSIMVFAAPTSAWRIARDASTSMMMSNFTSIS